MMLAATVCAASSTISNCFSESAFDSALTNFAFAEEPGWAIGVAVGADETWAGMLATRGATLESPSKSGLPLKKEANLLQSTSATTVQPEHVISSPSACRPACFLIGCKPILLKTLASSISLIMPISSQTLQQIAEAGRPFKTRASANAARNSLPAP